MKELNLSYEEFLQYKERIKKEQELKKKMGYSQYNKMKELGFNNYEEYKQYLKEQKFKKYKRKREKDNIRQKTFRYIERYCDLKMKCQICNAEDFIQIHHPNYKEYLKVNLLCQKHHTQLHNFELIPPNIIDLEKNAIKKPPQKEKIEYIKSHITNMKIDILKNRLSYKELENKYQVSRSTLKRWFEKEDEWEKLNNILTEIGERKKLTCNLKHKENKVQKYRIENKLTAKDLSKITGISVPTIRKIENGQTDLTKIRTSTRKKLEKLIEEV